MTYYVDRTDGNLAYACREDCRTHFKPFESLKKASKYAREHGFEMIVDDDGNAVAHWLPREEVLTQLKAAQEEIARRQKGAQERAERDQRRRDEEEANDIKLINAGYIPVERLRNMVTEIRVGTAPTYTTADIRCSFTNGQKMALAIINAIGGRQ